MHLTSYNDKIDGNKLKKIKTLTKLYPNEILMFNPKNVFCLWHRIIENRENKS